jgi:hypothetical protein
MTARPLAAFALVASLASTAAAVAEPPASPSEQRRICRGGERQLGTRMRTQRRCRTEAQWRQEDEEKARLPIGLQTTQGQNDGIAPAQPR